MKYLIIASLAIVITASTLVLLQRQPEEIAQFVNGFPVKPDDGLAYVNTTELKYLDQIALFELKRGKEHVKAEFAMAILDKLPTDSTAEEYAAGLFKAWDVGRKDNGRGILYLLIQDSGQLKIETSYELESLFPDIYIASYQGTIKEFFKNDQLGDVISHLVVEMIHRMQDPAYEMTPYEARAATGKHLSGGGGITGTGYAVNRIEKSLEDGRGQRFFYAKYEKASTPKEAVDKFLASMSEGISSPHLGILTEGSQYMAMEYHRTPGYQRNRFKQYQRSLPYNIIEQGTYAVARFEKNYVRPIFLRQNDQGLWFVDEAKMWAFVDGFVGADGDQYYVQIFANPSPWSFAVNFPGDELMLGLQADRPDPVPLSTSVKDTIKALELEIRENPDSAKAYFSLADILFFENYWIKDAIAAVEKGLVLDPLNERYLRRAIFFGSKMPDYRYTPAHFEALLKLYPSSLLNPDPEHQLIAEYFDLFKKHGTNVSRIIRVTEDRDVAPE